MLGACNSQCHWDSNFEAMIFCAEFYISVTLDQSVEPAGCLTDQRTVPSSYRTTTTTKTCTCECICMQTGHSSAHTHTGCIQYMQGLCMPSQHWHTGTGNAWSTGWQRQRDWHKAAEWIHWSNNESVVFRHYFRGKWKITLHRESGFNCFNYGWTKFPLRCFPAMYVKSSAAQRTGKMKEHLLWLILSKLSIPYSTLGCQPPSNSFLWFKTDVLPSG